MYTYFIYIALSRAHVSQFPRIYLNRDYSKQHIPLVPRCAPAPALILSDTNLCLTPTPLLFIASGFPITIIFNYLYWTQPGSRHPATSRVPIHKGGTKIVGDFHQSGLGEDERMNNSDNWYKMGCCQSPKQRLEARAEGGRGLLSCSGAEDGWQLEWIIRLSNVWYIVNLELGYWGIFVICVRLQNYSVVPPLTFMDSTKVLSEFLLKDK